MNYVVGIDGGGTKTKLIVCNLQGEILDETISGPSNILSSGYDIAKASIQELIVKGIVEKGYLLENCLMLCIGVAGAGRTSVIEQLEKIIREVGYDGNLLITHDAETALIGGTSSDEGILIIAGTGVICYGKTKEGITHRVSGWGHLIGDEGSAYSIGIKIMKAVMKAYDGRGDKTILTHLLLDAMAFQSPEEIVGFIYQPHITKQHIASYAALIDKAYKHNDKVAVEIVQQTIEDLFKTVEAILIKLAFIDKPVKVVINGSVLLKNEAIQKGFKAYLNKYYPLVEVCQMKHDAAYGAAIKALQEVRKVKS